MSMGKKDYKMKMIHVQTLSQYMHTTLTVVATQSLMQWAPECEEYPYPSPVDCYSVVLN
jgi:hypothetical protein